MCVFLGSFIPRVDSCNHLCSPGTALFRVSSSGCSADLCQWCSVDRLPSEGTQVAEWSSWEGDFPFHFHGILKGCFLDSGWRLDIQVERPGRRYLWALPGDGHGHCRALDENISHLGGAGGSWGERVGGTGRGVLVPPRALTFRGQLEVKTQDLLRLFCACIQHWACCWPSLFPAIYVRPFNNLIPPCIFLLTLSSQTF